MKLRNGVILKRNEIEIAFDAIENWSVLGSNVNWIGYTFKWWDVSTKPPPCPFKCRIVTKLVPLHREGRKGDAISPKLFTNAIEDVFTTPYWKRRAIKINGEYISTFFSVQKSLWSNLAGGMSNANRLKPHAASGTRIRLLVPEVALQKVRKKPELHKGKPWNPYLLRAAYGL